MKHLWVCETCHDHATEHKQLPNGTDVSVDKGRISYSRLLCDACKTAVPGARCYALKLEQPRGARD